ncbi:J domain-containing protein [Snodgrassella alvi]|uniref:J domain-containing protein n=1 Tax=Snodgrassella alvi TaxID=1196083 RepID=UPI000997701C|nr:hypothetical protein [Snodgrassella alvi]OOX79315.1 hypothetical protein BGH94_04535 [Snodgrassella alvi]ORF01848.1 hypothetical protein BGH95_06165 [Snodgrassella alvi]
MQMAFKNLYELLGVKPTATDEEILNAMRRLAQLQLVELDDLKLCKSVLLNPEMRKRYDAKLFAEYPEVLEELTNSKSKDKPFTQAVEEDSAIEENALNELSLKKPLLALNSKAIPIYNENTGEVRLTFVGQSFFPLIIGVFTPLLIGDFIGFLMCLGLYTVLAILTGIMLGVFGIFMMAFIFNVVLCLQYCNFYTLRKIKSGFKLCGTTEQKKLAAKCLKIKLTPNNTISNSPKIVYEKKSVIDIIFAVIIWFFIVLMVITQIAMLS